MPAPWDWYEHRYDLIMKKIKPARILTHPFFIGLFLTAGVLALWRPDISQYRTEFLGDKRMDASRRLYFFDLDHDGSSEELAIDYHPPLLKMMLIRNSRILSQYNMRSQPLNQQFVNACDFDGDGFSELYLFTMRNDSLMLSVIDPFGRRGYLFNEKLIHYNDSVSYLTDVPEVYFLGCPEPGPEGGKYLYFAVNTGFSKRPRGFFRIDMETGTIIQSPVSGLSVQRPEFFDLAEGPGPEIIMSGAATGNHSPAYPFTDHSSWLMVLDSALQFLFPPVEFPVFPSSLQVRPVEYAGEKRLVSYYQYYGTDSIASALRIFDAGGNLISSARLEKTDRFSDFLAVDSKGTDPVICLLDAAGSIIRRFNLELEEKEVVDAPRLLNAGLIARMDLEGDGSHEYFFLGEENGTVAVFREGLKDPVLIDAGEGQYPVHISRYLLDNVPQFYMQFNDRGVFLKYGKNPFHLLVIPLILALYAAMSLLVFMVFRIQQYRAEARYRTERKISELQILNLKNQIDPHFTFNILNSIGSMYVMETDKNRAYNLFVRYSNLLRYSLKNSDRISVPIEEELSFVRNYIELEQSRSHPRFHWEIDVGEQVDLGRPIPRMIIHSFVENAIKHGIQQVTGEGKLLISVKRLRQAHRFEIRDNGPGPHAGNNNHFNSSGKGLKIIDDLILLFRQLEGIRISYSIEDRSVAEPGHAGTLAVVTIPDHAGN